jgi:hypothetical protein
LHQFFKCPAFSDLIYPVQFLMGIDRRQPGLLAKPVPALHHIICFKIAWKLPIIAHGHISCRKPPLPAFAGCRPNSGPWLLVNYIEILADTKVRSCQLWRNHRFDT